MFEPPVVASLIVAVTVPATPTATGITNVFETMGGCVSAADVTVIATVAAALLRLPSLAV
jgi:hypothetical protein